MPFQLENGEIETRINKAVLRVPECGQCRNCVGKGPMRKLCENRMAVRKKLVAQETKAIEKEYKADKKSGKKRKPEQSEFKAPRKPKSAPGTKKKVTKMMKISNGQLKPRVTSQGNKRMSIPDEVFPDFCRRIGAKGTGERMKLINDFAAEHPTVSVRQVTLRLGEITTKELPAGIEAPEKSGGRGRAFMFYLRPRFYKHLPPEDLPENWEKYAEEDERKWQLEQSAKKAAKAEKAEKAESVTSDRASVSPSVVDDDGEETEDEGEPAVKRLKIDED